MDDSAVAGASSVASSCSVIPAWVANLTTTPASRVSAIPEATVNSPSTTCISAAAHVSPAVIVP